MKSGITDRLYSCTVSITRLDAIDSGPVQRKVSKLPNSSPIRAEKPKKPTRPMANAIGIRTTMIRKSRTAKPIKMTDITIPVSVLVSDHDRLCRSAFSDHHDADADRSEEHTSDS